jgi:branched-chain amino acid transport system substrate-binding protein
MRRPTRRRFVPFAAASATALAVAACGSTSASTTASSSAQPITIGISLPLTGSAANDFSADGLATEKGYQLWASDVNKNGGLLGRPVRLKILDDKSNEKLVTSQYTQLITQDHVNLVLAPFSTLLTSDAQAPTAKAGYALLAGSATGGLVFAKTYPNFFSVSVPAANEMVPFAQWVISLPPSQRQTAAYPEIDDPFADPPVDSTQAELSHAGVRTVYPAVQHPATTSSQIKTEANAVVQKQPQIVVIGSVDLPSLLVFIHTFQAHGYTPKIMIAASGPDQGQAFINTLNPVNAQDIMVPDGWYGGIKNPLSEAMVKAYIAKYGGSAADINADVAEAYSVGEITASAVTATKGLDNKKIMSYLHSGVTLQTVQGPVKFNSSGENTVAQKFIFQWQTGGAFNQVLPTGATGSVAIINPKPSWAS